MSEMDRDPRAYALRALGLGVEDLAAWRASGQPDDRFDDWVTDRVARRPSGSRAREVYGAEDVHDFARRAILDALALGPEDHLPGGLRRWLVAPRCTRHRRSRDRDRPHEEMVELARGRASGAQVVVAQAESLPFDTDAFTAVAMSVVFFFLDDPDRVLHECLRVMRSGGRLANYTTAPELRGTPAAPEPIASRGHFYSDQELADLAAGADFRDPTVRSEQGGQLLTARA